MDFSTIKLVPEFDTLSFPGAERYHRPEDDGAAMTVEEALFLSGLLIVRKPSVALELGCSTGFSTAFLADAASRSNSQFIAVDADPSAIVKAKQRTSFMGVSAEFVLSDATEYLNKSPLTFDFVLIDTDLKTRQQELWALWPKLSTNGIVAIHDASPLHPLRGDTTLMKDLYELRGRDHDYDLLYVPSPRGIAVIRKVK